MLKWTDVSEVRTASIMRAMIHHTRRRENPKSHILPGSLLQGKGTNLIVPFLLHSVVGILGSLSKVSDQKRWRFLYKVAEGGLYAENVGSNPA
jgi:hypothetical protein